MNDALKELIDAGNKVEIGEYLAKRENTKVLRDYISNFTLNSNLVLAMQQFVSTCTLPKDNEKLNRLMSTFARCYLNQHKSEEFRSYQPLQKFTLSILNLNDLQHNPTEKRVILDDFIRDNASVNAGESLPREYMTKIFQTSKSIDITSDIPEEILEEKMGIFGRGVEWMTGGFSEKPSSGTVKQHANLEISRKSKPET